MSFAATRPSQREQHRLEMEEKIAQQQSAREYELLQQQAEAEKLKAWHLVTIKFLCMFIGVSARYFGCDASVVWNEMYL